MILVTQNHPRRVGWRPPPSGPSRARAGFTMVEIAICIAVVAFAMVAIIGVLPTGFQVQKDNREDTIINQEGLLWMEAIRSGARGMDYLTNYVDFIQRIEQSSSGTRSAVWRYGLAGADRFKNGFDIVGLLTEPKYGVDANDQWVIRQARAVVRAIGGSAIEKTPANEFAFSYLLTVEVVPFNPFPPALTNHTGVALSPEQLSLRFENYTVAQHLAENAHELRLVIEWPVEVSGSAAQPQIRVRGGRKVFRVLATGYLDSLSSPSGAELYWKQPAEFRYAP